MTQEQKAKRYDEVLKAAVVAHKDEDKHLKATLERIFPELAESEDEKIRKEIIYHIQHCDDTIDEETEKRMLAWLEKQGEQKVVETKNGVNMQREQKIIRIAHRYASSNTDEDAENYNEIKNAVIYGIHWSDMNPKIPVEWSEEDERMVSSINQIMKEIEEETSWNSTHYNGENVFYSDIRNWLKSIRPQNRWKPSEEQMEALKGVQEGVFRLGILESLYQDLKKLKE